MSRDLLFSSSSKGSLGSSGIGSPTSPGLRGNEFKRENFKN
jgi:hypothetical protein